MRVIILFHSLILQEKAISNNGFLFLGELAFYLYLSGSISCESLYYCCRHSNLIVIGNIENFSSIISNILIIFLFIFGGLFLLIIFVYIEKIISNEYPMFHFSLFKIKSFLGGNIAILLNSIARGDFIFLISLYLQGSL